MTGQLHPHPQPVQPNGVQHVHVEDEHGLVGRLTRRPDAPGWFVVAFNGIVPMVGGVLRTFDDSRAVRYFDTPDEALAALAEELR
jgi:hypothetical protein